MEIQAQKSIVGSRFGLGNENELIVNGSDVVAYEPKHGAGTKNGATVVAYERGDGILHETVLVLTNTPISVVSVTTAAGVGGTKIYDMPEGHIIFMPSYASLVFSVAAAKQADFTDATPEGDYGIGTAAPADADALGADATDDDICTAAAITMAGYVTPSTPVKADADSYLVNGSTTAADVYVNLLIDAVDIDDGVTTEVLATGTVVLRWMYGGNI